MLNSSFAASEAVQSAMDMHSGFLSEARRIKSGVHMRAGFTEAERHLNRARQLRAAANLGDE